MSGKSRKEFYIAGAVLWVFILSCNHADRSGERVDNSNKTSRSQQPYDTVFAGGGDMTISLKAGEVYVIGNITANKAGPEYTLPVRKGQALTALLKPLKKGGNVRINQLQLPGGAFDGPFGDSIHYTFKRNGNIRFIIGENLMAGHPYTGDFVLRIILSEP